jgi:pimeloyl-ACP methyl ester carboxylesterase
MGQRMRQISLILAALGVATMLVACGFSGNSNPTITANPTITGLAATGGALANATVTAKCTTGVPVSGTTGADGTFSLELAGGQIVPCLVQVSNGTVTLHGFAAQAGHINVTPLTDLVISKALGSDPATAFASFDAAKGTAINAGLDAAKTYVKTEITALTGGTQSVDPLTGVFKVGDADDKVLDTLNAALVAAGKKLDDLRLGAESGVSLAAAVARGTLVDTAAVVVTLTVAQIDGATSAPPVGSGLQAISGKAKCDVKVVSLNYNTVGVSGEKTNASGVMLVPVPTGSNCTTPAGLVAYAKGTDVQKPRTLANPADAETFLLAAVYAAQGYAVVATDYLGYAKSAYAYHPYLHADSEATSVIDSIRAARNAATTAGASLSGKVMLTGYSQGGHSSMAAHRAIERDNANEINVVAGAHLAGPYNLSGSFKSTAVIAGYQFFVPFMITAWQKVYGTIYSDVTTVFKTPYSGYIESLLPSPTLTYTTLVTTGKLPGANGETPTQARDLMFQSAFITDVQTNNNNALYLAAKKNDLLGWSPKSKVLLCGGAGDPTVPPALHMIPMKADFDSRSLTNVSTVDVDPYVQATYGTGGKAPTDPLSAAFATYYGNYHGTYEPPFCHAQAKVVFDTVK